MLTDLHWSLIDSKSLQISRTLLSIAADLDNAIVWMISILPLIFNSATLISKPLETVPSAPTIIDITVTFIFHIFSSFLARSITIIIILLQVFWHHL